MSEATLGTNPAIDSFDAGVVRPRWRETHGLSRIFDISLPFGPEVSVEMLIEQDFQCDGLSSQACICVGHRPGSGVDEWDVWQAEVNELGQIVSLISLLDHTRRQECLSLARLIGDQLAQPVYLILPNHDLELIQPALPE
ncbi:MAG: hypothetical protein U0872_13545 [Planctomycetaceae bacterium]